MNMTTCACSPICTVVIHDFSICTFKDISVIFGSDHGSKLGSWETQTWMKSSLIQPPQHPSRAAQPAYTYPKISWARRITWKDLVHLTQPWSLITLHHQL